MSFGPIRNTGGAARPAPYQVPEELGGAAAEAASEPMWTCISCGNTNFAKREVCNTRKCRQPRFCADSEALAGKPEGSWRCPSCTNVNYPNRSVCNTKKCQMPHPGMAPAFPMMSQGPPMMMQRPPMMQAQTMMPMAGPPMGHPAGPPQQFHMANRPNPAVVGGGGGGGQGQQPPNWTCPGCGNLNFGTREVCNTRKCRLPRPFSHMQMPPGPQPRFHPPVAAPASGGAIRPIAKSGGQGGQEQQKEPKWVCVACGNENFAFRDVCNTRKCRAPRPF